MEDAGIFYNDTTIISSAPTPQLRWNNGVLQQAWLVKTKWKAILEWRDIPIVNEQDKK